MAATFNTDDEITAITEQRLELTNSKTLESDLDFAFNLQLEEALTASLSLLPSSSSSSPPLPLPEPSSSINNGDELNFADIQSEELEKLEQERRDREFSEIEAKKLRDDLNRCIHDQNLLLRLLVCLKMIGMNLVMSSKGLLMKVPRLLPSSLRFSGCILRG